jgi:hypothetical protein
MMVLALPEQPTARMMGDLVIGSKIRPLMPYNSSTP